MPQSISVRSGYAPPTYPNLLLQIKAVDEMMANISLRALEKVMSCARSVSFSDRRPQKDYFQE